MPHSTATDAYRRTRDAAAQADLALEVRAYGAAVRWTSAAQIAAMAASRRNAVAPDIESAWAARRATATADTAYARMMRATAHLVA